jgi:hypothetical protein
MIELSAADLTFTSESARSARQHKAWGAASEASKPQDRNPKRFQPAERATDFECGGERGATRPLWIDPITHRLSPAQRVLSGLPIAIMGPQAPGKGQKHLS